MVLLHITRSGVHKQPSSQGGPSDDLQEADERDDVVDARGAQILPSSSPPPATATKTVWATRRPLPGNDYHCEDSDGMGTDACQIRCGYIYRDRETETETETKTEQIQTAVTLQP